MRIVACGTQARCDRPVNNRSGHPSHAMTAQTNLLLRFREQRFVLTSVNQMAIGAFTTFYGWFVLDLARKYPFLMAGKAEAIVFGLLSFAERPQQKAFPRPMSFMTKTA